MKLYFLRHGESAYNLLGRCNADPAVPVALTPAGRRQAEATAERLRDSPILRIYVSRLQRARETAAIVNASHCAPLHVDARLDDRRTGYEGRPVADYLNAMQSAADPFAWKAGGGESYHDMVARVHAFLDQLTEVELPLVLVVTHHEVLQAVSGYFHHLDPEEMWRVWVDHCELLEFEVN
jgi:broad specificity phosphatase PhoE